MITVEKGVVLIPYPFGEGNYHFTLDRAGEKYPNSNYSDWIIHLAGKTWVTMPILEELAEILKREVPEIDWEGSLREASKYKR